MTTAKTAKYLLYNNKCYPVDEPIFKVTNRSFRYGDGLFETIRLIKGQLHLFDYHIERILNGAEFLRLEFPNNWNQAFFKKKVHELLEKNQEFENGKIRLSIFRADGGTYAPKSSKANLLIEYEPLNSDSFILNKKGLKMEVFSEMEKTSNPFSNFKSSNALIYVLASMYRKEEGLDDCFIVNSQNRIIEGISSNLFIVKDGSLITPPLSEGCVAGVMRSYLLNLLEEKDIECRIAPIQLEDLFQAQEIFLTDSIKGIRWVGSYKVKRYNLNLAEQLNQYLNEELEKPATT
jgi:branched-subunit amino acid aminotransferase/4-amino-4-deoxychorismate lyase